MIKQARILNAITFSPFCKLLLLLAIVTNPFLSMAQQGLLKKNGAEIQYVGTTDGQLHFLVNFQTTDPVSNAVIEIKDHQNRQLYFEKIKDTQIKRQFAVEEIDVDDAALVFLVTINGKLYKQTFDISRSLQVVTDISIAKQ